VHVVIVGAGPIGLYGGWLRAGGVEVSYIARRAALRALRQDGLTISGDRGALHQKVVRVASSVVDLDAGHFLMLEAPHVFNAVLRTEAKRSEAHAFGKQ